MKTMTRTLVLFVLMMATLSMSAQKTEIKDQIQKINNEMIGAILNDDYGKILTYYDDKVISMPNYGPMIRGIDQMKEHQMEAAEKGNKVTEMSLLTKKINDYGDVVIEIGTYTITLEMAGMETPVKDAGKYLTVWRKHDNTYKILNEIWNTDVYPGEAVKMGVGNDKPKPAGDDKGSKLQKDKGNTKSGKKPNANKEGN